MMLALARQMLPVPLQAKAEALWTRRHIEAVESDAAGGPCFVCRRRVLPAAWGQQAVGGHGLASGALPAQWLRIARNASRAG
jgi:hypothetical protein